MTIVKTSRVIVALALLAGSLHLPADTNPPSAASAPDDLVLLHDVVIGKGGDRDLHAEIAYPKNASALLPAIVFIHGGGWIGGTYKQSPIIQIAHAGYFAASIEYRLSNVAKWPAQIQDSKLGVRWLRANAAQYHVDPNRIGAWGESAGGHLVACLGTMADVKAYEGDGGYPGVSSAVQAVVDYYGPTDFVTPGNYSDQAIKLTEGLFGVPYKQNPELWKSGSPVDYVKAGDPPVLMVHGDADTLVPLAQSTVFDAALTKAGVPHQLLIVKNAGHGLGAPHFAVVSPSYDDIRKITYAFLDKYLKTP
jgi:acetyl esterase/lipase